MKTALKRLASSMEWASIVQATQEFNALLGAVQGWKRSQDLQKTLTEVENQEILHAIHMAAPPAFISGERTPLGSWLLNNKGYQWYWAHFSTWDTVRQAIMLPQGIETSSKYCRRQVQSIQ